MSALQFCLHIYIDCLRKVQCTELTVGQSYLKPYSASRMEARDKEALVLDDTDLADVNFDMMDGGFKNNNSKWMF